MSTKECVGNTQGEADYYCYRQGENLAKTRIELKELFDSYVKSLFSRGK